METITKFFVVGIGGALGAIARYGMGLLLGKLFAPFPIATFAINISGSFLIGFLMAAFGGRLEVSDNFKILAVVGFLGAYTTFSTFEFETFELVRERNLMTAFLYVALSFALGLIGVFIGVWLGRKL